MLPERQGPRRWVPLRQLASFGFSEGLNEINRDNGKRRIIVEANVRGRDIGSFVAEAQAGIARDVKLPPGSWLEWGGQFENLEQAVRRLEIVVPICMILIFAALYMALGDATLALTVHRSAACARGRRLHNSLALYPLCLGRGACGSRRAAQRSVLSSIRRRLDMGEDVSTAILRVLLNAFGPC
jgi:cobalt-zinc-cadmium resistance protein CzcA